MRSLSAGHVPRARTATLLAAVLLAAASAVLAGCTAASSTVPGCRDPSRLAIVAQSVPGASEIPCIRELPQGWSTSAFHPARGGTTFMLNSDRSAGRPVRVELAATCRVTGASASPARAPGVLTYTRLHSTSPRVAGTVYDVFPGGCVSYRFDFTFGPHIALIEQFEGAIGLYPRQQLRLTLKNKLGVELGP
jgi:hypothetical protein